jgi:Flavodoxin domain
MRALVIYESMYGNTHLIAHAIAAGLADEGVEAEASAVDHATPGRVADADLVVVGGPTHVHGMSRESTRKAAATEASKPENDLDLDPDAEGEGLREWFDHLPAAQAAAAAFDTRIHKSPALTGRASKGISKRLRRHGFTEVVEAESFFVDADHLEPGEELRAREWGRRLARFVADREDSDGASTLAPHS